MPCIALDISYPTGNINLINSKVTFNTVSNVSWCESSFYSSLLIFQAKSNANIFISNSLFYFNGNTNQQSNTLNGSLLYYNKATYLPTSLILIRNTRFIFNGIRGIHIDHKVVKTEITLDTVSVVGNNQGVLYNGFGDNILLNIFSSIFAFNSNGALSINAYSNYGVNIEIYSTTFGKNKGSYETLGTAIFALVTNLNSTINASFCSFFSNTGGSSVAQFSTLQGNFPLFSINLSIASCNFTSNKIGPALYLKNCLVKLYSSVLFQDNSAKIYIAEKSQIIVDDKSNVQFINNTASLRGGAMYIDLTNCYDQGIVFADVKWYDTISFVNNSAKLSHW